MCIREGRDGSIECHELSECYLVVVKGSSKVDEISISCLMN